MELGDISLTNFSVEENYDHFLVQLSRTIIDYLKRSRVMKVSTNPTNDIVTPT